MKFLFVAVALLGIPLLSHADQVDQYVEAEMAKREIPGLALTLIQDGKITKTAGYGFANLELKAPVKPETVFEIGSVTKQFTAACILVLQQEGKLSVDDKIAKYLPETPATWSEITIRHLLNHTSGIKNYNSLTGFELTKHLTQKQFITALSQIPLEFQPGDQWKYFLKGHS